MVWNEHGSSEFLPTPSSYSAEIVDTDNDSYSSAVTGELIDSPIAVGMLKLSMSWDFNSEEESEMLINKTYKNPLILDIKIPAVKGGFLENAYFRVSNRKTEMVKTEKGRETSETIYKVSFNLMQKKLTDIQKAEVEEANNV